MLTVTPFEIHLQCLPNAFDGFRIVHLSDLHDRRFGKENSLLAKTVLAQHPDLVVSTGDMLDRRIEGGGAFLDLARQLVPHVPVYAVRGNHEQAIADSDQDAPVLQRYEQELRGVGVILLNDGVAQFFRNGEELLFYGVAFPKFCYKPPAAKNSRGVFPSEMVAQHVGMAGENRCCILLAHTPLFFASCADWGADLVLSGHMHGGLIRLPKFGGLLSPYRRFFPKYDAGLFVRGSSNLVVSRGLGGSPLRVCNPPEVVVITLRTGQAASGI